MPSFVQLVRFLLSLPGVEAFLSTKFSQDPLETFFGLQRQRGRSNENPTTVEFLNNTEHLRVINSFCQPSVRSNCRGKERLIEINGENNPLPKRRHVIKASYS